MNTTPATGTLPAKNKKEPRFKFTKTAILALESPPAQKRSTYYDTEIPKLAIRLTSAGSRTFYVVKRSGYDVAWLKLGVFPDMTVERAREEAHKVLAEFAHGINPAQIRRAVREEWSFKDAFDDLLTNKRKKNGQPLADRTKGEYESGYSLYLTNWGKRKLSQISRENISNLINQIGKHTPTQANRIKALISSIFSHAINRNQFHGINPAHRMQGFAERERDRYLQQDELPRFFKALLEEDDTVRDLFLVALLTGVRRSNVVSMRWQDINFTEKVWRSPPIKGNPHQMVPLVPEALEILQSRKTIADKNAVWVFPGTGKAGHYSDPSSAWQRIINRDELFQLADRLNAAGIAFNWPEVKIKSKGHKGRVLESLDDALIRARGLASSIELDVTNTRLDDLRIHDLRRTLGSWQANTGTSLAIIGKSLNHKSHKSTMIYARINIDPVRNSVNKATSAMLVAGGLKTTDGAK